VNEETSTAGRLAYWKAKAKLCKDLFDIQVEDKNTQSEALANLERFIEANRQVDRLTHGVDFSWLYPTIEGQEHGIEQR
jgi:hypothetical protein